MLPSLLHLFTPHHTNNHRPKILHPSGLSLLIGIYLFTNASLKLLAYYDAPIIRGNILGYASNIAVADVISLVNQERLNNGLGPLTENAKLSTAANAKATDMFASDYWAHNNPKNGRQPWNFIRESSYVYRYAGENLARDFGDTPSMVAAWMASPTHRDNIVSDRYKETGVAVVNGELQGLETTLVVQMFGTRAGEQAVSAAQAESDPALQDTIIEEKITPIQVAQASSDNQPIPLPPLAISKSLALSILAVLAVTLIIDYFIITRRRIIRLSGKNFAHLAFFTLIAAIVIIIRAGNIL